MPSKKRISITNRRARGVTSDLMKMEEGRVTPPSKQSTPPPSVKFHRITQEPQIQYKEPIFHRPPGFDENKLLETDLIRNESKAKMYSTELSSHDLPPFQNALDVFENPTPERRRELARAASEERKEAEFKAENETKIAEHAEFVNSNKVVPPPTRTWWARGKKSRKVKKSQKGRKGRKGRKHSTRRK